jgi:hypothetical protein
MFEFIESKSEMVVTKDLGEGKQTINKHFVYLEYTIKSYCHHSIQVKKIAQDRVQSPSLQRNDSEPILLPQHPMQRCLGNPIDHLPPSSMIYTLCILKKSLGSCWDALPDHYVGL